MHGIDSKTLKKINDEAIDSLMSAFIPADTVYVIYEKRSRSGETHGFSFFVVYNNKLQRVTMLIQHLTGYRWGKNRDYIITRGGGMDMAFNAVYSACAAAGLKLKRHHIL